MLDLKAQLAGIREEIRLALDAVVESQRFILGPQVRALEESLAPYCHCRFAIGVSSGSDALLVALMAAGIGPTDEVVTTPFTFFATVGAITRLGAKPVFADIDPMTYNLDARQAVERITPRTRALLPVHLYGQCVDMPPLLTASQTHGLTVIEDAAQAIGAEDPRRRRAGSLGDIGCFSFFPSKNLGAFGDAGLVTTNDPALAERIALLRGHGSQPKYYHKLVGGNFRMDSMQATVLLVKLNHLEDWTRARQRVAARYRALFQQAGLAVPDSGTLPSPETPIVLPATPNPGTHVYNQFVLRACRRDDLRLFLGQAGVDTTVYYPLPMHLQECFGHLGHRPGDFPEAERATREVVAIPIYPELLPDQQDFVVDRIKAFYRQV